MTTRRGLVTDGGETFCVACGEPFDPERDACPACGRPVGGEDESATESTSDPDGDSPESLAEASTSRSDAETELADPTDDEETTAGAVREEHDPSPTEQTPAASTEQTPAESTDSPDQPTGAVDDSGRRDTVGPNEEYCKDCGRVVSQDASTCPHCGRDRSDSGKRPLLAGVISFFLPGSGQMYIGQLTRGSAFLVGALLLYAGRIPFLGISLPGAGPDSILFLGVAVWAAYDAYTGAKEVNSA